MKLLITGTTDTGKTTISNNIATIPYALGRRVISAREIAREQIALMQQFDEDLVPWSKNPENVIKVQDSILLGHVAREQHIQIADNVIVVYDTGLPDSLSFRLANKKVMQRQPLESILPTYLSYGKGINYDLIGICMQRPDHTITNDPQRQQTRDEADLIQQMKYYALELMGYKKHQIFEIPYDDVYKRVNFIFDKIESFESDYELKNGIYVPKKDKYSIDRVVIN